MRIRKWLIITIALSLPACNTLSHKTVNKPDISGTETVKSTSDVHNSRKNAPKISMLEKKGPKRLSDTLEQKTATNNYPDIWHRIRDNLVLDRHAGSKQVKDKVAWYQRNQDYLDRVAERATPYIYYVVEQLEKRNMPLDLALLPVIESAYHPFAYSPSRASGIWQFIPSTGRIYGLKQNWWYDGRRDIVEATRAALDYLEKLHKEFNGDWLLALAAYNSGELNVARAIRKNADAGKKQDFWSLRLPRETRGYVPSLLAVAEIVNDPARYHINLKPVSNDPYFAKIDTGGQIDLALAADLAGLTMDEMYTLNPGFNQWATDPDGPHTLLVPLAKEQDFISKLAQVNDHDRIGWKQHVIQQGESLNLIAQRYNTSVAVLQQVNNLRGNLIRTGHSLLIPSAKQPIQHYTMSASSRRYRGLKKGDGEKYLYTVTRGDTLWDIGRNYGVSVKSLQSWNNMSSRDILRPGQKLNLYISSAAQSSNSQNNATVSSLTDSTSKRSDNISYTVRKGDSLWLIARRHDVELTSLQAWNGLKSGNKLYPGQKLAIRLADTTSYHVALDEQNPAPLNYTVKKGDSLWLISKRFGTTVEKLRRWNKLPKGRLLQPGQVLVLYIQEA